MCALRDNGRNQQHDVNDRVNKCEYTFYLTLSEAESLKQKPHRNPGVKITLNGSHSPDSTRTTISAHEKYSPFPNSRCLGLCCSDTKVAGTQNHCISTSDGEPLPVGTENGNFP